MRVAFFLLVLANLVFFAWAQGYLGGQDEGREPQRLADQLHPEKMKVTVSAPAKAAALPPQASCRVIDGLAAGDAEQLRKALGEGGLLVSLRPGKEAPGFWVSIPALANKALADRKAAELKLLGVHDFHVMQAEGGPFAISLGVFDAETPAAEFLQTLGKKGVKSARMEARPRPAVAAVEVRGPAATIASRLPPLLAGMAGASVGDCP